MKSLGHVAYDAYLKRSGGVSLVSGAKLPSWNELSDEIKSAWEAAGSAVANIYRAPES